MTLPGLESKISFVEDLERKINNPTPINPDYYADIVDVPGSDEPYRLIIAEIIPFDSTDELGQTLGRNRFWEQANWVIGTATLISLGAEVLFRTVWQSAPAELRTTADLAILIGGAKGGIELIRRGIHLGVITDYIQEALRKRDPFNYS